MPSLRTSPEFDRTIPIPGLYSDSSSLSKALCFV